MTESASTSRDGLLTLPGRSNVAAVGRYATRYPGSAWLDLLARRATSGEGGAAELIASAQADPAAPRPRYLADFAFVLAACAEDDHTLKVAADLFTTAAGDRQSGGLDQRTAGVWLQTLHLSGQLDDAANPPQHGEVGEQTWWGVQTDRVNPFSSGAATPEPAAVERWLGQFSAPFTRQDHQALVLRPGDGTAFDRLATPAARQVDGPLVSVVVPVYNPSASLLTSIYALLQQTWANLEVLICDDGSVTGLEYLDACTALTDDRVRVLRSSANYGRYAALNRGLAVAGGEYVTFQDADDYAHPERLEIQLRTHLAEDALVATTSQAIRASAQLMLTSVGMRLVATNASSFMFRRRPVLDRLGGYDTVRKAADNEFINRFAAVFGADRLRRLDDVLAVIQTTPNSLSRGELGFLRRHPARQAYRAAADAWHDQIRAGADPQVRPGERAPFPAPAHITGTSAAPEPCDVALLTSLTCAAPTRSSAMVAALTASGTDVALVEFVAPQDALVPAAGGPDPTVGRLLAEGTVHWALPGEPVRAAMAVVDDPEALLVMPGGTTQQLEVEALVMVFDEKHVTLLPATERRLAELAHLNPVWLPATAAAAAHLRTARTSFRVLEPARWWVGADPAPPRARRDQEPTIVGMMSGRFTTLPPAQLRPRPCIPRDPETQLWSWGPCPAQLLGRPVNRVRPSSSPWREFLRQVDYFIAPTTGAVDALVMDAWSVGASVLAAEEMQDTLGDRALYPGRVGVDALLADGATTARADAGAAGRRWAREHISAEALVATYRGLHRQLDF